MAALDDATARGSLLSTHGELLAAAGELGALLSGIETSFDELEGAAATLDEAALAFAAARRDCPGWEFVVEEVTFEEEVAGDPQVIAEATAEVRAAAVAVAELAALPGAAVDAARTVLGRAAARLAAASRGVVGLRTRLVDESGNPPID